MRAVLVMAILAAVSFPAAAAHCETPPAGPTLLAPAPELMPAAPITPACLSAQAFTLRMKRVTAGPPQPTAPVATRSAGGYVPKTKDDNSPWRFDMNQNGRRMTAEEFDAWMKAKGIRVATGKPAGGTVAAPADAATVQCQPSATVSC